MPLDVIRAAGVVHDERREADWRYVIALRRSPPEVFITVLSTSSVTATALDWQYATNE